MGNRKRVGARIRGRVLAAIIATGTAVTAGCHSGGRPVGWHAAGERVAELSMPLGTGPDRDFRTVELRLRGSEDGPSPVRFEERVLLVRDDNVQPECALGYAERTYPDGRMARFRLSGCIHPDGAGPAGGALVLRGVRYLMSATGAVRYETAGLFEMRIAPDTWSVEARGGSRPAPAHRDPDQDSGPADRDGWWSKPLIDRGLREARV